MNIRIINVTPHTLNFRRADGTEFEVIPSGVVINATAVDEAAGNHASGAELVRARFSGNAEASAALDKIEAEHPGTVVVGSLIAAQAYPGRVFGMVAASGYERRPPAEKRMNPLKFTTFA